MAFRRLARPDSKREQTVVHCCLEVVSRAAGDGHTGMHELGLDGSKAHEAEAFGGELCVRV